MEDIGGSVYTSRMADLPDPPEQNHPAWPGAETPSARAARLRWEAAVIAKGHADIEAGLGLDFDAVEAWLEELERDPHAPLPRPRASTAGS
jgi:hypothetical protein